MKNQFNAIITFLVLSFGVIAQSKGMQFIGAAGTNTVNANFAADQVALADRGQITLLPFEFEPTDPFRVATTIVHRALPQMPGGVLRVGIYLEWWPHDAQGLVDQQRFWQAWATLTPNAAQVQLRNGFLNRVHAFDNWALGIQAWCTANGYANRIRTTAIPVLEDTLGSSMSSAYTRLLNSMRQQQQADGISTSFRRSPVGVANAFRVDGATLELHGPFSAVRNYLIDGDSWSNDGTTMSLSSYQAAAAEARFRGVNTLYWTGAYNGWPYAPRNWSQRTVDPFTGSNRVAERARLHAVMIQ